MSSLRVEDEDARNPTLPKRSLYSNASGPSLAGQPLSSPKVARSALGIVHASRPSETHVLGRLQGHTASIQPTNHPGAEPSEHQMPLIFTEQADYEVSQAAPRS